MGRSPFLFPSFLDFLNDEDTLLAFLATIVLALVTGTAVCLTPLPRRLSTDG
jgi:hypothetical protein